MQYVLYLIFVNILLAGFTGSKRLNHRKRRGEGDVKGDIIYYPQAFERTSIESPHIAIFIHAALGVFHKIRGNGMNSFVNAHIYHP